MKTFLVYKITCIPTNQIYIGVTSSQAYRRFHSHFYNAQNLHKKGKIVSKFQSELLKYGKDYFKCSILEEKLSKVDALKKEIFYIEQYNSNLCGLNSNSGGGGCPTHNDETKKKMSKSRKGIPRPPEVIEKVRIGNLGKKLSKETRQRIRDSKIGRKASEETKNKMSKSHTGKKLSEETILRIKNRGDEVYEKMRKFHVGRKRSPETCKKISESLKEVNKNNLAGHHSSSIWKVTFPQGDLKMTKNLKNTINNGKLELTLKYIHRQIKTVKNISKYKGLLFPYEGYTLQKVTKVHGGIEFRKI